MKKKKLTDKEERACQSLLTENSKAAAYRANYNCGRMKPATINRKAIELYDKTHIIARVTELKAARSERTGITADWVLNQAVKIHERTMQEVKPKLLKNGDPIKDDEGNPVYEFDARAALGALKLVGDHVNVQAFKKVIDVEVGAKKSLQDLLKEAAKGE